MKHRQSGMGKTGVLNSDGHAIGVDIGATAVRASILTPGSVDGRPAVTLNGSGRVDLAPGVVVNGEVREPAALTLALKQLWRENKFNCRNVILGMANPQVIVRDLSVPNLDPERRAKALPYQAKEVVALPIDEVVLDFCELGAPDPSAETVRGLLVATPRQPVLTAVLAVEKANLKVARVDLSSLGLLRAAADERPAVEAVVDLGAHLTTIVIHERGVPKLVRTLARGSEEITRSLAERMDLQVHEAEQIKREQGLDGDHAEINRAVIEALRPLVAEIRTSIGYFRSSRDNAAIEGMSLSGGGAQLRGIVPALTDQIALPTRVVDPMQHIRNRYASREGRDAELAAAPSAVSLGLAMGAAA